MRGSIVRTSRVKSEAINDWLTEIFAQALPTIVGLLSKLRRNGDAVTEHVFIVADTTDTETRRFVSQLGEGRLPDDIARYVAAVRTDAVARALTASGARDWARWIDAEPRGEGTMRVLVAAKGRANAVDVPMPPLPD